MKKINFDIHRKYVVRTRGKLPATKEAIKKYLLVESHSSPLRQPHNAGKTEEDALRKS